MLSLTNPVRWRTIARAAALIALMTVVIAAFGSAAGPAHAVTLGQCDGPCPTPQTTPPPRPPPPPPRDPRGGRVGCDDCVTPPQLVPEPPPPPKGVGSVKRKPKAPRWSIRKVAYPFTNGRVVVRVLDVYFSKRETRAIMYGGPVAATACGFLALIPPPAGVVAVAACELEVAQVVLAATIAVNRNKCLKLMFSSPVASRGRIPIVVPAVRLSGIYGGKFCT